MNEKELKELLAKQDGEIKTWMAKHDEEQKTLGKASKDTIAALEKLGTEWKETSARLLAIEQKLTAPNGGPGERPKSIGEMVVESDGFKAVQKGAKESGKLSIGHAWKTNIVNATGQNQPLVPDMRVAGIITPGLRRLTVRDILPQNRTSSNLVQFVKEASFTNNAAMQTAEGASKAESAMTFSLSNAPVQTLAHFIPASRQILDDAPALQDYINNRLMFGLKLVEEDQLLNGNGTGTNLNGLIAQSTVMTTTGAVTATDTFIDTIRRAKTQVANSFFEPDAVIINPADWETIQLTKTAGTASSGQYIYSFPRDPTQPMGPNIDTLWGMNVVVTPAMAVSQFLVGAFQLAAAIWDRADATVEVSREHASFFIQNLVAILVEERLALTVFRPLALIYGGFPFGS
jgi:HK97 family phage major capsid protein